MSTWAFLFPYLRRPNFPPMATKTTPSTEQKDLDIGEVYTRTELFLEKHKRTVTYAVSGVLIVVAGLLGYKRFISEPRAKEAADNIWKAQYYFEIDSLDKAINGDDNYFGFEYIASEYGSTPSGELAHFYLGTCYIETGDSDPAIEHHNPAHLDDDVLRVMAVGNIGDALVELDRSDEAVTYFEKAAGMTTDDFTTPMYLMKAGILRQQAGDWKAAARHFGRIATEFPQSPDAAQAKKYLGRAEESASRQ